MEADAEVGSTDRTNMSRSTQRDADHIEVLEIDMKVAESVSSGTRIFPEPEGGSTSNWCVFSRREARSGTAEVVFAPTGIIKGDSEPRQFVHEAYLNILMRDVDPVGSALYPALIENRKLSKRDVIRILADSEEARDRGISVIVIPEPSSWLGSLGGSLPSLHIVEKAIS
jgi:hypothetical protein